MGSTIRKSSEPINIQNNIYRIYEPPDDHKDSGVNALRLCKKMSKANELNFHHRSEKKNISFVNSNEKNSANLDEPLKYSKIPPVPKRSVPLANFSRLTRDRLMVSATDLSKTTKGAVE